MELHSVTCHPTQVNAPCLNPSQNRLYDNPAKCCTAQVRVVFNGGGEGALTGSNPPLSEMLEISRVNVTILRKTF